MKITFVVAAAAAVLVLTTAPLATPTKAQEQLKMAQVDVQIGRDRDRDRYDRDRRRDDATVGIGPGGVRIGPRQRCRMESTTIQRVSRAGSAVATKRKGRLRGRRRARQRFVSASWNPERPIGARLIYCARVRPTSPTGSS